MLRIFHNTNFDWLASRRIFIIISVLLMLAGLFSAVGREFAPGGTGAFNLGVDFKGGTLITAKFKKIVRQRKICARLEQAGVREAVIQNVTNKADEVQIKLPLEGNGEAESRNEGATGTDATTQQNAAQPNAGQEAKAQVDPGRIKVKQALDTYGTEGNRDGDAYQIVSTDAVGPVAGQALRNQAIAVTLLALVGILLFIAFRFEWTYGAAAVIAVFHDVLVTLGIFSIMQWEISLTVIAAILTLIGFSVNDTIVTFDRVRENLRLHPRDSLYKITNDSINQTLSRTIITSGLVLLSVVALVLFGGEVLRGFSLALLIGVTFGTYSSIAIASPIMVWWQQRLEARSGRALQTTSANVPPRANVRNRPVNAGGATRKARTTPAR